MIHRDEKTTFHNDTFELIWRIVVRLTLFALVLTTLSLKAQAQQTLSKQPTKPPLPVRQARGGPGETLNSKIETAENLIATNENTEPSESDPATSSIIDGGASQATPSPT